MNFVRLQTQLKLNRRLTGGNVTRVSSAWQWPSNAMDKKFCWDYPYARLHLDLRCLAEFLSVIDVYNLGQLPIASYSTKRSGVRHYYKCLVGF